MLCAFATRERHQKGEARLPIWIASFFNSFINLLLMVMELIPTFAPKNSSPKRVWTPIRPGDHRAPGRL